jgi:hypothetical protein
MILHVIHSQTRHGPFSLKSRSHEFCRFFQDMPLCTGGTVTERDIVSQKIRMINTRYRELIGTVVYRYRTGSGQVPGTNPVRYRYRH